MKRIELVTDLEGLLDYTVVPNFRALGPRLGPRMPTREGALGRRRRRRGAACARRRRRATASTSTARPSSSGPTTSRSGPPRTRSSRSPQEGGYAVALDTTLDDDLRLEGIARELVRALNDLRKALDLELSDRIRVDLHADGEHRAHAARRARATWIAGEVLRASRLDVHERRR